MKKDVKAYFEWFLSVIPERLRELPAAVTETPGFESWQADYTPESLDMLGEWFAKQVEARKRTLQEIAEIKARSPYPIEIPEEELTDHTFALTYDVGIYLGEVLRHQYHALQWQQVLGSKNQVYYGQAVLSGFGKVDFSPVHLVMVLAYGIIKGKRNGEGVRELYDIWSKMIVK